MPAMPQSHSLRTRLLPVLLLLPVLGATPVAAQTVYYGAFSYSPSTAAVGWGFDYPTRQEAEQSAMLNCRKHAGDCRLAITVRNGCAAIALGERKLVAMSGPTMRLAERAALFDCRFTSSALCEVLKSMCTTRGDP